MITAILTRGYALLGRMARLEGNWAGDMVRPGGSWVGRLQMACRWDAAHAGVQVRLVLVSRLGRLLDAEEGAINYDMATDSLVAVLQRPIGGLEMAHAYVNTTEELVFVHDNELRLRRVTWPASGSAPPPGRETCMYRLESVIDGQMRLQMQATLRQVAPPARSGRAS